LTSLQTMALVTTTLLPPRTAPYISVQPHILSSIWTITMGTLVQSTGLDAIHSGIQTTVQSSCPALTIGLSEFGIQGSPRLSWFAIRLKILNTK
jgi:hypothetical protein